MLPGFLYAPKKEKEKLLQEELRIEIFYPETQEEPKREKETNRGVEIISLFD